jgi:hypothetical protein
VSAFPLKFDPNNCRSVSCVSPDLGSVARELRTVRGGHLGKVGLLRSEFMASASVAVELRQSVELRRVGQRHVPVTSVNRAFVSVASVKSQLRQALSQTSALRAPVSRDHVSSFMSGIEPSSVALRVSISPVLLTPKCVLSSALQNSLRASRTKKVLRLVRRLAKLAPTTSV